MTLRSLATRLAGAAALAVVLVLAGCGGTVRKGGVVTASVPVQYDMVISAFKDKQYQLDGAVLSAADLEAHFRYLQDTKQLPKTVLMKDGEKTKLNNANLEEFASLALAFNFTGYIEHKGKLRLLSAVEAKPGSAAAEQVHRDETSAPRKHHDDSN
jgi:hypothetical protein